MSGMNQRELDAAARASLFAQLAKTERMGLSARKSAQLLAPASGRALRSRLQEFDDALAAGADLTTAGAGCGLFLPWEARLIRAAEASGSLGRCFTALADRYSARARRYARIRNGLVLPFAVMVVAVFVAPLPALFYGVVSGRQYLLLTAGRLMLFFAALFLLSYSWRRLGASGADNTMFRLILRLPYFGGLVRRLQQRDFLHSLYLALSAGIPAFQALPLAAESISHPGLRHRFAQTAALARNGAAVTDALARSGALPDENARNLLAAGEASGRSEEMLDHIVRQLDEVIDSQFKTIADWTPRVAYVLVLAFFVTAR